MEEAAGAFFADLAENQQPTEPELCVTAWKASEVPALVAAQYVVSQLANETGEAAKTATVSGPFDGLWLFYGLWEWAQWLWGWV